jgi:heme oxygenase (mycobilin-producing)
MRALSPDARFMFINIAEWESAEHFYAAVRREEFAQLTAGSQVQFPHYPGLYEVIRT